MTHASPKQPKHYISYTIHRTGFLSLMDEKGAPRDDIRLPDFPENFAREIRAKYEMPDSSWMVKVVSAMGHDQVCVW